MNKEDISKLVLNFPDNFSSMIKKQDFNLYGHISKLQGRNFSERLYRYIHGPDVGKCKACHTDCKFRRFSKGFRQFCSCKCRSYYKHINSLIECKCVVCDKSFEVINSRKKTTCSNECLLKLNFSKEVNEKRKNSLTMSLMRKYNVNHPSKIKGFGDKVKATKYLNHGDSNWVNVKKANQTKLERYGNKDYNNTNQCKTTMLKRYGVSNAFHLPKSLSNGKRISKGQRRIFQEIQSRYPDAILEHYLSDVDKSVDIYIPSEKKIIEFYGDYWHCNPKKYSPNYYNTQVHLKAKDIWKKDNRRRELLEKNGYQVEVIWENSPKLVKSP